MTVSDLTGEVGTGTVEDASDSVGVVSAAVLVFGLFILPIWSFRPLLVLKFNSQ